MGAIKSNTSTPLRTSLMQLTEEVSHPFGYVLSTYLMRTRRIILLA